MEFLFISYGNIDYDGRLRSLLNVYSKMGKVYAFTRGTEQFNSLSKVFNKSYISYIIKSIRFSKNRYKKNKSLVLVLDNRKATIPGLVIKILFKPRIIIYDARELYLINDMKSLKGKIGCLFEKMMIESADVITCANRQRSKIMQRIFHIKNKPIAYENLRKLEYGNNDEIKNAKKRISQFIIDDEFRIITTSGCSISRTNDILVENMNKLEIKSRLFIVGDSTSEDTKKIKRIISDNRLKNVVIIGLLNQTELKYLISQCHLGVVNYGMYDVNNKYCASGKLYEFLYEGIPVITTENPPLKVICDKYGVGISDNLYYRAINSISSDYVVYKSNVNKYTNIFTIKRNDDKFIKEISEMINILYKKKGKY